jgi:hypothetical protein
MKPCVQRQEASSPAVLKNKNIIPCENKSKISLQMNSL